MRSQEVRFRKTRLNNHMNGGDQYPEKVDQMRPSEERKGKTKIRECNSG